MEEYIREFEYLMLRFDINEPEEQTIARFLEGLKRELADAIQSQPFWTFNDVRKLASTIEQKQMKYSPKQSLKRVLLTRGVLLQVPTNLLLKVQLLARMKSREMGVRFKKHQSIPILLESVLNVKVMGI